MRRSVRSLAGSEPPGAKRCRFLMTEQSKAHDSFKRPIAHGILARDDPLSKVERKRDQRPRFPEPEHDENNQVCLVSSLRARSQDKQRGSNVFRQRKPRVLVQLVRQNVHKVVNLTGPPTLRFGAGWYELSSLPLADSDGSAKYEVKPGL